MALFKLQRNIGTRAIPIEVTNSKEPGVYVSQQGTGVSLAYVYFEVLPDGGRIGLTEAQAEEKVSNEVEDATERLAHALSNGDVATGKPTPEAKTAQAVLAEQGHDFDVIAHDMIDAVTGEPIKSSKRVLRGDTGAELSIMKRGYALIPARKWFRVTDKAAAAGRIEYTTSYVNSDSTFQSLGFVFPGQAGNLCKAGGMMTTSHDGSMKLLLNATATVPAPNGSEITIYSAASHGYRHSSGLDDERLDKASEEILTHALQYAEGVIVACGNAMAMDAGRALDAAVKSLAKEIETRAKVSPADDDKVAAEKRAEALAEARTELTETAGLFDSRLGGLRFVAAAGWFGSRSPNGPSVNSWHYGAARKRATAALLTLAAEGAVLRSVYGSKLEAIMGADTETREALVAAAKQRLAAAAG